MCGKKIVDDLMQKSGIFRFTFLKKTLWLLYRELTAGNKRSGKTRQEDSGLINLK